MVSAYLSIRHNLILSFIYIHLISWMLICKDVFLLCARHVGVDFCRADGAVAEHSLYVADVNVLLQQKCGK